MLALHDLAHDYILHTDASDLAIGDALTQTQPWGPEDWLVEWPRGFLAAKLHEIEMRHAAYDHNFLVIQTINRLGALP